MSIVNSEEPSLGWLKYPPNGVFDDSCLQRITNERVQAVGALFK